jgi:hypothetical protein
METTEKNEMFYKSLSNADWEQAVAIETELVAILHEGLTEDVAIKFIRTVMDVRKTVPQATVGGIFDAALSGGLTYVVAALEKPAQSIERKTRKGKLAGAGL